MYITFSEKEIEMLDIFSKEKKKKAHYANYSVSVTTKC